MHPSWGTETYLQHGLTDLKFERLQIRVGLDLQLAQLLLNECPPLPGRLFSSPDHVPGLLAVQSQDPLPRDDRQAL